jgi:N-acetylglutamate synthase-like GNAT family acetyltransferase
MSEVMIRKAKNEDAEAIHRAHMKSIREVCVRDHGKDEIKGWGFREYDEKHRLETINRDPMWVVEFDGEIEGYAHLRLYEKEGEKKAHMWALYLTTKVIGKGLGLKLVNLMLERARSFGADKITLQSSLTGHEFYKKIGFKDTGPLQKEVINGHTVRNYPMEMNL